MVVVEVLVELPVREELVVVEVLVVLPVRDEPLVVVEEEVLVLDEVL